MLFGRRNVELFFFARKQMSILRVKGTNLHFPNRADHSLHAEAFNADCSNSVGSRLSFFFELSFIPMPDPSENKLLVVLIWLDEYKMQISGRGDRAGIK